LSRSIDGQGMSCGLEGKGIACGVEEAGLGRRSIVMGNDG